MNAAELVEAYGDAYVGPTCARCLAGGRVLLRVVPKGQPTPWVCADCLTPDERKLNELPPRMPRPRCMTGAKLKRPRP